MLDFSMRSYGAGRSILVDRNGVAIAGNKTLETAASVGIEDIIVVPTDGTKLIVHQRVDLELGRDKEAHELALADNRVAEVNLEWDPAVISTLAQANLVEPEKFFFEGELEGMQALANAANASDDADTSQQLGDLMYRVVVECSNEAEQTNLLARFAAEGLNCKALIS